MLINVREQNAESTDHFIIGFITPKEMIKVRQTKR
jgi:hypothetical protein